MVNNQLDINSFREEITNLSQLGWTVAMISRKTGIYETRVKRNGNRWGLTFSKYTLLNQNDQHDKKWGHYSKTEVLNIIKDSYSYASVLKKLSLSLTGGNQTKIKRFVRENNVDISHFTGKLWSKGRTLFDQKDLEKILTKESSVRRSRIKQLLLHFKIFEYKCAACGNNGIWNNKKLTLTLHHINGDPRDHRLCNLELLCPLCHAQTDNYCSKNRFHKNQRAVIIQDTSF